MSDTYQTFSYGQNTDTSSGSLAAVLADIAALVTLQAAMVVVGTGNNSTNVTTMGTDLTTLSTDLLAATGGGTPAVVLLVNTSIISTGSSLRAVINLRIPMMPAGHSD
jgi:hypothetical protein